MLVSNFHSASILTEPRKKRCLYMYEPTNVLNKALFMKRK